MYVPPNYIPVYYYQLVYINNNKEQIAPQLLTS